MGYLKHHSIVVTGWDSEKVKEAHQKAKEIFEKKFSIEPFNLPFGTRIISNILDGLMNDQTSFFIAPDGSKEGWKTSDNGDEARKEFVDWLKVQNACDYVEVVFGGDDDEEKIIRSSVIDFIGQK